MRKKLFPYLLYLTFFLIGNLTAGQTGQGPPHMANGVKIGEVTSTGAIIWTRLTKIENLNTDGIEFNEIDGTGDELYKYGINSPRYGPDQGYLGQLPNGKTFEEAVNAVPGMSGLVRLTYWRADDKDDKIELGWIKVDDNRDFTKHFTLQNLQPAEVYHFQVECRKETKSPVSAVIKSSFRTAAVKNQPERVVFTVVTGTSWDTRDDEKVGHKFYAGMEGLNPNFFVHTGDVVYYDHVKPWATHINLARFRWNRIYALPAERKFHNHVPAYFMKDDHDTWQNDCWRGMKTRMGSFTFEQGLQVFDEQVPMSDKTYRTFRWGKDLQIWLVEVRNFRSPNQAPDGLDKTMWGKEQVEWFKRTVKESDAAFRILISPTPMVGPDHLWKSELSDNHADPDWAYEGSMLRKFISGQKNMYFICGDRHWQYVSREPETGLLEYSSGPSTDKHATELKNPDHSMLLYYRPKGGFLSVSVERIDGKPTITFRHHNVDGKVHNEDRWMAQ